MSTAHELCFDAEWYLSNYKDVAVARMDPLKHYLKSGRFEGRKPCAPDASLFMSAWNLARLAASKGDWAEAQQQLNKADANALCATLRHPDATLLVLEVLTVSGSFEKARQILDDATSEFGPIPALALAKANLIASTSTQKSNWASCLAPAFPKKTAITLTDGPKPAFDRITAKPRPKLRSVRSQAKVTVIVPVLNADTTLGTALSSLIAQTWKNLEILVIDNGSTDTSKHVAEEFSQQDPRISILDASDDPGAYAARNIGLAAATGSFITVLDADDWAHPDKIACHVKALTKTASAQASLSDWARATSDLRFTNTRDDVPLIHSNMSSLMIRKSLRESLGFWDRVQADADTEYHRRIVHRFGKDAVVRVKPGLLLSIGRSHGQSLTQANDTALTNDTNNPRQVYQRNAAAWHAEATAPFMAQYPTSRPFPAPEALTRGIKTR